MSLRTISRWMIAIGCVGALPLFAQTTTTTTTTETRAMHHKAKTEVKETKAEEKKETKAVEKKETKVEEKKAEEKKETKTVEKKEMKMHHAARTAKVSHLTDDATRLAAILDDTQTSAMVNAAVWKTTANEANTLANRVYANARTASEKKAAREARTHVREMRDAAMKDDAASAKSHAAMALPFVYQVIDASAPK